MQSPKLQEYVQKHKINLQYELLAEEGPDHNKQFTVRVVLDGKEMARKVAHSKKTAEQYAAFETLESCYISQLEKGKVTYVFKKHRNIWI